MRSDVSVVTFSRGGSGRRPFHADTRPARNSGTRARDATSPRSDARGARPTPTIRYFPRRPTPAVISRLARHKGPAIEWARSRAHEDGPHRRGGRTGSRQNQRRRRIMTKKIARFVTVASALSLLAALAPAFTPAQTIRSGQPSYNPASIVADEGRGRGEGRGEGHGDRGHGRVSG